LFLFSTLNWFHHIWGYLGSNLIIIQASKIFLPKVGMEVEICFSFGSHGQADEGLVQDHHDLGKRVADFQLVE